MSKISIAIVSAEFNKPLVDAMVTAAGDEIEKAGAKLYAAVSVPGSYELPLIVHQLLAKRQVSAVVALGYIERGETGHGEVMGHVVHGALMQMSLDYQKPVGLGIIGPGATAEQAEVRKEAYARAAVKAALASLSALKAVGKR